MTSADDAERISPSESDPETTTAAAAADDDDRVGDGGSKRKLEEGDGVGGGGRRIAMIVDDDGHDFDDEAEEDEVMADDGKDGDAAGDGPISAAPPSASAAGKKKKKDDDNGGGGVVFSPELLGMYYSRLFPFRLLHAWLSYDPSFSVASSSSAPDGEDRPPTDARSIFGRREFSFTIDVSGQEVYIRYQSYRTVEELTTAVLKRKPRKIDIGAVFNRPPKDRDSFQSSSSGAFRPVQRELVFDIDLTDYDEVRNCGCKGADICKKCWTAMTMAIRVMDEGLREDFGFEHIAWFYSGRRGVHAWVCDENARMLSNEARSAVASYFEVSLGTDKNKNVALPTPLHPMLSRSYEILEPMFVEHVLPASGHGILSTPEAASKLLKTLPLGAEPIAAKLEKMWKSSSFDEITPQEKWDDVKRVVNIFLGKKGKGKAPKNLTSAAQTCIETWPIETVFRHSYPRLDINVSKARNHLLKSPFCVHPKTGRVCVPIDPDRAHEFDPFDVPTLPRLMREIDEYETKKKEGEGEEKARPKYDWEKTSLKGPFRFFEKKFLEPMMKEWRKNERVKAEEKAALIGDF